MHEDAADDMRSPPSEAMRTEYERRGWEDGRILY
jgi:hypothetical protein